MPATDPDVDPGIEYGFIIKYFYYALTVYIFKDKLSFFNSINVMLKNERPFINELRLKPGS